MESYGTLDKGKAEYMAEYLAATNPEQRFKVAIHWRIRFGRHQSTATSNPEAPEETNQMEMSAQQKVIAVYPDAQIEEHFYGSSRKREYWVSPKPWHAPLAKAHSPNAAWELAATHLE